MSRPKPSAACVHCGLGSRRLRSAKLLRFLLFLLADADFELLLLGFLVSFPVEPLGGLRQIFIDVDIFGEHSHEAGGHGAVGTGNAVPFHVRDGHNTTRIAFPPPQRACAQCAKCWLILFSPGEQVNDDKNPDTAYEPYPSQCLAGDAAALKESDRSKHDRQESNNRACDT